MRLNPYLTFTANARAAMKLYATVFGGEPVLTTFGQYGTRAGTSEQIMHGMLETEHGFTLMASDLMPGMEHSPGNNITISLSGDDADALRGYWKKLSRGGQVSMPLEKQMWGDEFGQVWISSASRGWSTSLRLRTELAKPNEADRLPQRTEITLEGIAVHIGLLRGV